MVFLGTIAAISLILCLVVINDSIKKNSKIDIQKKRITKLQNDEQEAIDEIIKLRNKNEEDKMRVILAVQFGVYYIPRLDEIVHMNEAVLLGEL